MKSKKTVRKALWMSVLSIALCLTMLVGTTFAWFTDTASTAVNKIQTGNLDIEVEYTLDGEIWNTLDGAADLFQKGLWEPGHTEVVALKFKNNGNLALKYSINMNIVEEKTGINKAGQEYRLSDYLKVKTLSQEASQIGDICIGMAFAQRNDGLGYTATASFKDAAVLDHDLFLAPGEVGNYLIMKVYMPETVGNEANAISTDKAAFINFGLKVVATQATYESDSFGNTYDQNAAYPVTVSQNELNTKLTLADLPVDEKTGKAAPVEVTLGDTATEVIAYSEHSSGYTGKGVMLGSTNLNKYAAAPAAAGEYSFTFKNGTINSAATGYASIDNFKDTSVYMLVPGNSDVVFENMTFNGVVSFDIQKYTSPWSNLNSITFKNCTFNGIIIGTCPASNVTFDGCTFNAYTNMTKPNNSNPIWWREDTEGSGDNANPIKTFTFVNNTVVGTRPVKIERIGKTVSPVFTIKNNQFDISKQTEDNVTKNMAINIGMGENPNLPFTLIDEGNTISSNTAALYTASLTGGSNWYKEVSGMKVLDGNGNAKTITAMVWKTTTGETFEMKSVD